MVLGTYYLTISKKGCKGEGKSFCSYEEVVIAYENKIVEINSIINFRLNGKWYKNTLWKSNFKFNFTR